MARALATASSIFGCASKVASSKKHRGLGLNFLRTLTPGDFAAVVRQSRFRLLRDAGELAERLAEECAMKGETQSGTMGFLV